ncbi:MAG: T9SS type A sorting domain-containing protein [bacterium]|nr:T9SS type A sorting domain-containing protein [bacterium]
MLLSGGIFFKTAASIFLWSAEFDEVIWMYLGADLAVGATLTTPVSPSLTGWTLSSTVVSTADTVSTMAGVFMDAVDVAYNLDLGVRPLVDESGNSVGTASGSIRGHVYYVPDIGPVKMVEDWIPYEWVDCAPGTCPAELQAVIGRVVETQAMVLTGASAVPPRESAAALRLRSGIPNPFNPRTTIQFAIPTDGAVRLTVFDVAGRLVRTLVDENRPQGSHEAVWDGRDATGREMGSGSYLARLEFGGLVEMTKISLMR